MKCLNWIYLQVQEILQSHFAVDSPQPQEHFLFSYVILSPLQLHYTTVNLKNKIKIKKILADLFRKKLYWNYSKISVTVPAPTVLPPSLIENLVFNSIEIGAINSIVKLVLSPGITISCPAFKWIVPVTSVVLT